MSRVLIAGCGYVGTALARRLLAAGWEVHGLRRDPRGLPEGVAPVAADLTDPRTLTGLPTDLDAVVYTASPDERTPRAYRDAYVTGLSHLLAAVTAGARMPGRLVLTTSTAVFGEAGGGWVGETTPPQPTSFSGHALLEAECVALAGPVPASVVRLGGIYGPGRSRLVERVRQGSARCVPERPRYTNRIHREDCAGVLHHLLGLPAPDPVYVAVDDAPAERCEVVRFIADRLGVSPPPEVAPGEAASRRGGGKRCRNDRLKASGYRLRYPTYRDGYEALLAA